MALLGRQQARFVSQVSRETGLDPRVVGAWALAEQSGGAARGYEQRGYNNFLNIARTDSGDRGGAHAGVWNNPVTAARATAEWLRGRGPIASSYGKPAPGIRAILGTRGAQAQIAAIARSGWASGGYSGGSTLRTLFSELGGEKLPAPVASGAPGAAGAPGQQVQPGQLGINQAGGPDPALIEQLSALLGKAQAPPAVAGRSGVKPPPLSAGPTLPAGAKQIAPIAPKPDAALASQIEPLLQAITQSAGESSVTSSGPTVTSSGVSPHSLAQAVPRGTKLRGFLPGNAELQVSRIDQGQDLKTNAGGAILAPGSGYVIAVKTNPGGFGNNYPIVHFTSGPLAGHDVYIGHTHAAVRQGAHFPAGAVLSHTGHGTPAEGNARTPGWAEIGLWPPGNMQAGQRIAPLLGLRR